MLGPTAYRIGSRLVAMSGYDPRLEPGPPAPPMPPVRPPVMPMAVSRPPVAGRAPRPDPASDAERARPAPTTAGPSDRLRYVGDEAPLPEGPYRPNGLGARVVSAGTANALPPQRGWGRIEGDDRLVAHPPRSSRGPLVVTLVVLAVVLAVAAFAVLGVFDGDDQPDGTDGAAPPAAVAGVPVEAAVTTR